MVFLRKCAKFKVIISVIVVFRYKYFNLKKIVTQYRSFIFNSCNNGSVLGIDMTNITTNIDFHKKYLFYKHRTHFLYPKKLTNAASDAVMKLIATFPIFQLTLQKLLQKKA